MGTDESRSFEFLYNIGDVDGPYEIIPGSTIDRATPEQVAVIKTVLSHVTHSDMWGQKLVPPQTKAYEHRWTRVVDEYGNVSRDGSPPLDEQHWRYFVVNTVGTNGSGVLRYALSLIDAEPELLFRCHNMPGEPNFSFSFSPTRAAHFTWQNLLGDGHLGTLTVEDLEDVKTFAGSLTSHDEHVLPLRRLLDEFLYLSGTDPVGRLRLVGHFSIIESLLSHAPKPSAPYDSITRQIRGKMALIGNRGGGIDHERFFAGLGTEKVWNKLYSYRSVIAHGGEADFSSGDFRALKNDQTVLDFVRHATRGLLRFALREPALLRDLKWT